MCAFDLSRRIIHIKNVVSFRKLQYELRLAASDNLKENYTTVVIHVKDVNDNPPVFERPTYRTQITEEDDRNLPKRVLQVILLGNYYSNNVDILFCDFCVEANVCRMCAFQYLFENSKRLELVCSHIAFV